MGCGSLNEALRPRLDALEREPAGDRRRQGGAGATRQRRPPDVDSPTGAGQKFRVPRRFLRTRVRGLTTVEVNTGDRIVADVARLCVVGIGGACLALQGPYPIGRRVQVRFTLPGTDVSIACGAVVRNADDYGVGVEFLNLAPDQRHELRAWVGRVTASTP